MCTTNTCANCGNGEESAGDLKSCTACKLVKYCNRDCQIAHRPQHKKLCKKRAAELHDEQLFKDPPPREECPICMMPLPAEAGVAGVILFKVCCGKTICMGCIHAMAMEEVRKGKKMGEIVICAFCRTPQESSNEEGIERVKRLMENGNADAFNIMAKYYVNGEYGMPQDRPKANALYLKAGELGCANAYSSSGYNYSVGRGVEIDTKKAKHYYELGAMKGDVNARYNLGLMEGKAGNHQRAYKHMIIAARAGYNKSLDIVKKGFNNGHVTKDEYAGTLRAYHECQSEMKSEARDKAADFQRRGSAV